VFNVWDGVHVASACQWPSSSADLTIYCSALLSGLGFWLPDLSISFANKFPLPPSAASTIVWYEATCVLHALAWAALLDSLICELFSSSKVSKYSPRSGGATFFAIAGWPENRIQAVGR
jgi:hypothetical protein